MTPTKLAGLLSSAVLGIWMVITIYSLATGPLDGEDFRNISATVTAFCVWLICWPDRDAQDKD